MTAARILAVCTGNVCRSAMTERLLRAGLEKRGVHDIEVASAGTGALVGQPMTDQTLTLLTHHGGLGEGFVSRALDRRMVEQADLVLALTRMHRGLVVSLYPRAVRYAFTLREVERLLPLAGPAPGQTPAERLRALPALLAARRGFQALDDPAVDDVVDPYRQDDATYAQMAAEVVPAVRALLHALAPVP